ncbi:MAG: transglutaminase family protein [bacterium]
MKPVKIILLAIIIISMFWSIALSKSNAENWMNVFLMGEKIGYMHETKLETTYNNEPVLEVDSEMISKLSRFGLEFNVRQYSQVYLAKDYSARYCKYEEEMMGSNKIITATVRKDKLLVDINLNGDITRQTTDWSPLYYFDAAVTEKIIHDGLTANKKYQFKIYSPELARWFDVSVAIGTTEQIEVNKVQKSAIVVYTDYAQAKELSSRTWITKDGQVVKADVGNYGMAMVQVSEAEAKEFRQKMEVKNLASISSNVNFDEPSAVTKMRVNIISTEGDPKTIIPEDSRQQWEVSHDTVSSSRILVITANQIDEATSPTLPLKYKDESITRYLSSSPYIQSDDTAIIAVAKQVVGNEKNAAKAAIALCHWVNGYVENKGFDTGFASAKETLQSKRGDCTEHSVLLAALTRSIGIPTKIATGITYADDAFYYHMWVEVYLGKWMPLDPTMDEIRVNATHIKLAETETREDELSDYALKLLRSLKKFQLQIIDYDIGAEHHLADEMKSKSIDELDLNNLNLNEQNLKEIYKQLDQVLNNN